MSVKSEDSQPSAAQKCRCEQRGNFLWTLNCPWLDQCLQQAAKPNLDLGRRAWRELIRRERRPGLPEER